MKLKTKVDAFQELTVLEVEFIVPEMAEVGEKLPLRQWLHMARK